MISDVVDRLGVTKFTMGIFFLTGLVLLFDGLDYMVVAYTMPQIAAEWGLSKIQTGSLVSWGMAGLILGGLIIGPVSDRIGRKKALILSCIIYSACNLPIYFAQNLEMFAIFRVLSGIGIGACVSVSVTMMSEFAPTKKRGALTASVFGFYVFGWVLAGLMAIYIVPNFGWRVCYLAAAAPVLYAIVMGACLRESPYWLLSKGREEEAVDVINRMELVGNSANVWEAGSLLAPPPPKKVGVKAILSKEYRTATIGLWILCFSGLVISYGFTTWMPSLLIGKGFSVVKGYSFAVVQNSFALIGALVTGLVADKIGRKKNIIFAYIFVLVSMILLAISSNSWQVIAFSILAAIAMNYGQTGLNPLFSESYRTEFRNTGIAWTQGFGRFGGLLTPLAVGWLQQTGAGFSGIFVFFAVFAVINVLVGIFIVKETKGRTFESLAGINKS